LCMRLLVLAEVANQFRVNLLVLAKFAAENADRPERLDVGRFTFILLHCTNRA